MPGLKKILPKNPAVRLLLIVGFALVVAALGAASVGNRRADTPAGDRDAEPARAIRRHLDGVVVQNLNATNTPVLAVVIDDTVDAQPASGVAAASLVFEMPVEGPITRLLAFYTSESDVSEIGPVRSARPYCADFVKEVNATFTHVGGSPAGLDRIAQLNLRDLNEFSRGKYFWRSGERSAPHNAYTSSELLRKAIDDLKFGAVPEYEPWLWKDDSPAEIDPATTSPPHYPEGWEYDAMRNAYRRPYGKGIYRDADGSEVWAKNVVLMRTDIAVIDAVLRKRIRTTGEGSAVIFQDGKKFDGVWKKKTPASRLRFYAEDGSEIQFNAGLTWIIIGPTR